MLGYYNGSLVKALEQLLPEIGLVQSNFNLLPRTYYRITFAKLLISLLENYWESEANRRKVFIEYAEAKGLDPFVPATWQLVSREDFLKAKVKLIAVVTCTKFSARAPTRFYITTRGALKKHCQPCFLILA